ncbi:MAG: hypothetical protein LBD85_02385 [Oscillospiraceae bacterium]|jgi:hypothetical protein|nr:hypothetical protein [Oscillospiraceae bacterium]
MKNELDSGVKYELDSGVKYEKLADDPPPGAIRYFLLRLFGAVINVMLITSCIYGKGTNVDFNGVVIATLGLICAVLPSKKTNIPLIIVTALTIVYRILAAFAIL